MAIAARWSGCRANWRTGWDRPPTPAGRPRNDALTRYGGRLDGLVRVSRQAAVRIVRLPGQGAILLVRLYQLTLSPLVGRQCRFEPTCSNYFIQAVEKYGLLSGLRRGVARILRCQPWHPGGFDPP